ncbi:MAG: exodeoxyribonuclease VII small subunit [Desulfuromonadales bacterium]|nr:exodeoxyribonuclease VII small subunit [Desulfuromonadales bacterium]NIR34136.1 exodeoxyribonuclease VII small subunit [Desulfuromonadales bacterium]NIS40219.1 exodeoxyribonuclease VII small subunit [Desulfuromonadales bacterium]
MAKKRDSFEADLKKLEEIVETLESGDLPLEESMARFEEGVKCAARCRKTLESAELKVEKLLRDRDGGHVVEPFEED